MGFLRERFWDVFVLLLMMVASMQHLGFQPSIMGTAFFRLECVFCHTTRARSLVGWWKGQWRIYTRSSGVKDSQEESSQNVLIRIQLDYFLCFCHLCMRSVFTHAIRVWFFLPPCNPDLVKLSSTRSSITLGICHLQWVNIWMVQGWWSQTILWLLP